MTAKLLFSDVIARNPSGVFYRLTIIEFTERVKGRQLARFRCECGNIAVLQLSHVMYGTTKSCGCFQAESRLKQSTIHGHLSDRKQSGTYTSWQSMLNRCSNKKWHSYHRYGGRGITVCERWLDFTNFLADMGQRPNGTTLDRRDNDRNYEKDNCCWATRREQANNRAGNLMVEYRGRIQSLQNWSRELNANHGTLRSRIVDYKWPVDRAFTEPLHPSRWTKGAVLPAPVAPAPVVPTS